MVFSISSTSLWLSATRRSDRDLWASALWYWLLLAIYHSVGRNLGGDCSSLAIWDIQVLVKHRQFCIKWKRWVLSAIITIIKLWHSYWNVQQIKKWTKHAVSPAPRSRNQCYQYVKPFWSLVAIPKHTGWPLSWSLMLPISSFGFEPYAVYSFASGAFYLTSCSQRWSDCL